MSLEGPSESRSDREHREVIVRLLRNNKEYVGATAHQAADIIERLAAQLTEAQKDAGRLQSMLDQFYTWLDSDKPMA